MATIKALTDLKQSKKLAEILPLESADMYYPSEMVSPKFGVALSISNNIPCWRLSALLGVLPEGWSFVLTKSFDGEDYYCKLDGEAIETMADNPVDACVAMVEKLHELNLL